MFFITVLVIMSVQSLTAMHLVHLDGTDAAATTDAPKTQNCERFRIKRLPITYDKLSEYFLVGLRQGDFTDASSTFTLTVKGDSRPASLSSDMLQVEIVEELDENTTSYRFSLNDKSRKILGKKRRLPLEKFVRVTVRLQYKEVSTATAQVPAKVLYKRLPKLSELDIGGQKCVVRAYGRPAKYKGPCKEVKCDGSVTVDQAVGDDGKTGFTLNLDVTRMPFFRLKIAMENAENIILNKDNGVIMVRNRKPERGCGNNLFQAVVRFNKTIQQDVNVPLKLHFKADKPTQSPLAVSFISYGNKLCMGSCGVEPVCVRPTRPAKTTAAPTTTAATTTTTEAPVTTEAPEAEDEEGEEVLQDVMDDDMDELQNDFWK